MGIQPSSWIDFSAEGQPSGGMNKLLELGYTNALDAYTNMYHPTGLYEALKMMDDAGELKLNIAGCYNIKSYDATMI